MYHCGYHSHEVREEAFVCEIKRLRAKVAHSGAEIAQLQSHLKAVRSEIEQSWQRVQAALSGEKQ